MRIGSSELSICSTLACAPTSCDLWEIVGGVSMRGVKNRLLLSPSFIFVYDSSRHWARWRASTVISVILLELARYRKLFWVTSRTVTHPPRRITTQFRSLLPSWPSPAQIGPAWTCWQLPGSRAAVLRSGGERPVPGRRQERRRLLGNRSAVRLPRRHVRGVLPLCQSEGCRRWALGVRKRVAT